MTTILVIDDDQHILRHVQDYLDVIGNRFKFLSAATHDEAKDMMMKHPDIDIIFMDGNLNPKVKALDTLELIDVAKINCSHAFIYATSSDSGWRKELVHAGCDREIIKRDMVSLDGLTGAIAAATAVPA